MPLFIYDFSQLRFTNVSGPTLPRRQRVRIDGMTGHDTGDEIVLAVQPTTIEFTTSLGERIGLFDGEVVQTAARSERGDGAGLTFDFVLGASAGADGYIVINGPNGQYRAREPSQLGHMKPEWFGAKHDGSADATAAINLAINTGLAMTPAIRCLRLGAGTYKIRYTPDSDGIRISVNDGFGYSFRGEGVRVTKILVESGVSDGGGTLDGGARSALWVEGFEVDVGGFQLVCENFADPRTAWGVTDTNIPDRVHGILYGGYRCVFTEIEINGATGSGFRGYGQSFQTQLTRVNVVESGIHGFHIQGNNTWKMDNCGAGTCGWGQSIIKVPDGQLCVDTLNSIIAPSYYPGLPHNGIQPSSTIIEHGGLLTVRNTNFEEFTQSAVYTTGEYAPVFDNCTFYSAVGGIRRTGVSTTTASAIRCWMGEFIQNEALFGNTNKIFDPGVGGWGQPDTGVVDGAYFQLVSGALPFIYVGRDRGNVWVSGIGALYAGTTMQYGASALGTNGVNFSNLMVTDIAFLRQSVTAGGPYQAICGHNQGDTTAGDVTYALPADPTTAPGRLFKFIKNAAANNLIITYGGGICDGASGTAPVSITLTGLYDAITIEAIGIQYFVTGRNL